MRMVRWMCSTVVHPLEKRKTRRELRNRMGIEVIDDVRRCHGHVARTED